MFTDPLMNDEGFFKRTICPDFDPRQKQFEFFWPLTEQIPLDLDYTDCAKKQSSSLIISDGTGIAFANNTWGTVTATSSNFNTQLSVMPMDCVGELAIGAIKVGLESEPKWYQKLLYKALGFNWKNK